MSNEARELVARAYRFTAFINENACKGSDLLVKLSVILDYPLSALSDDIECAYWLVQLVLDIIEEEDGISLEEMLSQL